MIRAGSFPRLIPSAVLHMIPSSIRPRAEHFPATELDSMVFTDMNPSQCGRVRAFFVFSRSLCSTWRSNFEDNGADFPRGKREQTAREATVNKGSSRILLCVKLYRLQGSHKLPGLMCLCAYVEDNRVLPFSFNPSQHRGRFF